MIILSSDDSAIAIHEMSDFDYDDYSDIVTVQGAEYMCQIPIFDYNLIKMTAGKNQSHTLWLFIAHCSFLAAILDVTPQNVYSN